MEPLAWVPVPRGREEPAVLTGLWLSCTAATQLLLLFQPLFSSSSCSSKEGSSRLPVPSHSYGSSCQAVVLSHRPCHPHSVPQHWGCRWIILQHHLCEWLSGSESWSWWYWGCTTPVPLTCPRYPSHGTSGWVRTLHCPRQCQAGDGLNGPSSSTWHGCPAHISVCHSASAHLLHNLLQEDKTCPVPGDVPLLLAEASPTPGIL